MEAAEVFSMLQRAQKTTVLWALVIVCLFTTATGCNWWLRITEVTGTVRMNDKPVSGVQVVFEPLTPGLPRSIAVTNQDGGYRLGRQGPGKNPGAVAGRYRVEVMSDTERKDPIVIPPEYNLKSNLEFEVVPGKANVFDIAISSTETAR